MPQTWEEYIPEEFRYKDLIIRFDKQLPVFPEMQPVLRQKYLAVPHAEGKQGKMFYTIKLKEGKPLIVYPGEFHILGVAGEFAEQECKRNGD